MVGRLLANGWPMGGQWLGNGWPMVGQCLANGWNKQVWGNLKPTRCSNQELNERRNWMFLQLSGACFFCFNVGSALAIQVSKVLSDRLPNKPSKVNIWQLGESANAHQIDHRHYWPKSEKGREYQFTLSNEK